MKCETCEFFVLIDDGVCRRYPPVPITEDRSVFPRVCKEDKCGEFKLNAEDRDWQNLSATVKYWQQ